MDTMVIVNGIFSLFVVIRTINNTIISVRPEGVAPAGKVKLPAVDQDAPQL
jgi:hypothetical protein